LLQNGDETWDWQLTQSSVTAVNGEYDGKDENVYQTKESAFEAAVAAASLAIKQGHEVQISVPASATASGAANRS
jgi:hypothetical protein